MPHDIIETSTPPQQHVCSEAKYVMLRMCDLPCPVIFCSVLLVVELTYNYGVDSYDIGEGFGHFGVALPDVYKAAETIKAGGRVGRV